MIKRTVEISREPAYLTVEHEQLLVGRPGQRKSEVPPEARIPFEDLGLLMVEQRDTTYTQTVLVKLAEYGSVLVVCGRDHLPSGMFLPVSRNVEVLHRLDTQLHASRPTVKRIWAQLVSAKINAQSENLEPGSIARRKLVSLARGVKSGDPQNAEAQAAAVYWPALFEGCPQVAFPFRRVAGDVASAPPNHLLDYGYAVFRAAVARALVSAGLLPAVGLKHENRSNAFCLADDLLEPLRPIVDGKVRDLAMAGTLDVDPTTKASLLELLTLAVDAGGQAGPLQVSLTRFVASLVHCLKGDQKKLLIPRRLKKEALKQKGGGRCGAAEVESSERGNNSADVLGMPGEPTV